MNGVHTDMMLYTHFACFMGGDGKVTHKHSCNALHGNRALVAKEEPNFKTELCMSNGLLFWSVFQACILYNIIAMLLVLSTQCYYRLVCCFFVLTVCVVLWSDTLSSTITASRHLRTAPSLEASLETAPPDTEDVRADESALLSLLHHAERSRTTNETLSSATELANSSAHVPNSNFPVDMPFFGYVKSTGAVESSGWVTDLRHYLQTLDRGKSPHVNIVFGDYEHRLLVLNWLTAALVNLTPPLHNALVLSLDNHLCSFLTSRDLPLKCITVATDSLLSLKVRGRRKKKEGHWKLGLMVRLPVIRLISHWGFDLASYDSDAVLVQNPQQLYEDRPGVHVFSSAGTFPLTMSEHWGFTLCAGTLVLRASPEVGETYVHTYTHTHTHTHIW